jgi:hypothetical protein
VLISWFAATNKKVLLTGYVVLGQSNTTVPALLFARRALIQVLMVFTGSAVMQLGDWQLLSEQSNIWLDMQSSQQIEC